MRLSRVFFSGLAIFALFCGLGSPLEQPQAGTAVRMNLRELTQAAELIIAGRVLAAEALAGPDGAITTELEISVDRTFQGTDAGRRLLRIPGGVLADGSGMLLPGLSLPRPGQEVLLFLSPESSCGWRLPVGLAQGHFQLVRLPDGRRVALRSQGSLGLWDAPAATLVEADNSFAIDYAELSAEIESARAWRKLEEAQGK